MGDLEQFSPLLGENIIDYPMLEEYGIPTVEEFPSDDLDDDDDDGANEEDNDSHETQGEKKSKKHQGQRSHRHICVSDKGESQFLIGGKFLTHLNINDCPFSRSG